MWEYLKKPIKLQDFISDKVIDGNMKIYIFYRENLIGIVRDSYIMEEFKEYGNWYDETKRADFTDEYCYVCSKRGFLCFRCRK